MLGSIVNDVKKFHENIYQFSLRRRDAAMERVDSLASNTQTKSVVELSLNPLHCRNYCSLTCAISEFYEGPTQEERRAQNKRLTKIVSECCHSAPPT